MVKVFALRDKSRLEPLISTPHAMPEPRPDPKAFKIIQDRLNQFHSRAKMILYFAIHLSDFGGDARECQRQKLRATTTQITASILGYFDTVRRI